MSMLLFLAACSGGELKKQTFTSNGTFTPPAGTTYIARAVGSGARGSNGYYYDTQSYKKVTTQYNVRNDWNPPQTISFTPTTTYHSGPLPSSYCDPRTPYTVTAPGPGGLSQTYTNYSFTCYDHTDTSSSGYQPPTTGTATTAFGRTFPGSYGNVAVTPTEFLNIPVTPLTPYAIRVPSGGSLTIEWYE